MSDSNETSLVPTIVKPGKLAAGAAAALIDPEVLSANVIQKLEALKALETDPTMPESMRQVVRTLAALAAPSKPGMEEMVTAWKVPRVNIVQPTSQSEAKPDSAKMGDLYTSAGQILERPFGIIPIYFYEENVNFPAQGKVPVCSAPDAKLGSPFGECAKCPHLPMGKQNGGRGEQHKTDCQNAIACVALAADMSQVCVIQFAKTSRKTGNALLALAGQQQFVWRQSYVLNTEKKTGDVGVYYVYKVEPTGKNNDDNQHKLANALYDLYSAERKRTLAEWYLRPARAPQAAIEGEGQFAGGALDVGLGAPGDEPGQEPDLSSPAVTPSTKKTSARASSKPM